MPKEYLGSCSECLAGLMVISVENGNGKPSSNPSHSCLCAFHTSNEFTFSLHHHLGMLTSQIPLTLSCYLSLSIIALCKSSGWHPVFVQMINISFCRSAKDVFMFRSPLKNVTYEFIFTTPSMPSMSCSSYLDGLSDRKLVVVRLFSSDGGQLIKKKTLYSKPWKRW